jgi:NTP pyrophosphatase (non-canonical NTP hydrolase)
MNERDSPVMSEHVLSLNQLRNWAHSTSKNHGFHDPSPTVGESVALMHSELSELLEDHRKGREPNEVFYVRKVDVTLLVGMTKVEIECNRDDSDAKLSGIPSELADCIIRCLDFAGQHNIDIESVLIEKMKHNESRPYRHGGKKL